MRSKTSQTVEDPWHIGFTGTRDGMTRAQRDAVRDLLAAWRPNIGMAHHGDCVGADAEFHALCLAAQIPVTLHPPKDESHRAHCDGAVDTRTPLNYLVRDGNIVYASHRLIATPKTAMPMRRSGTWYTYQRAVRCHVPAWLIHPDGSCVVPEHVTLTYVETPLL